MEIIFTVNGPGQLKRCYPIMKELRPHLSLEDFLLIYHEAHIADGYQIVALESEDEIVAVMGYRFLSDYVRGRHVYIDDLVASEKFRSMGFGAKLLKFAEEIGRSNGCKILRLCTGIENAGGIRFYERNGWHKRSYAYTKRLDDES